MKGVSFSFYRFVSTINGEAAKKQRPSNKYSQLDATINYRFIVWRLDPAQHVSGIRMPIIRRLSAAAEASGLP